jgi:hypothetical protein
VGKKKKKNKTKTKTNKRTLFWISRISGKKKFKKLQQENGRMKILAE